jgi:hypothetical protein
VRTAAAGLAALLILASVASADLYEGHATSGDPAHPKASIRTAVDHTARIRGAGVSIPCANGARLRVALDVRVTVRPDHTFVQRRSERLTLRTTGRATSREEYRGSLAYAGSLPHLRFTDVVTGARTTCRADVRFTFNTTSVQ